MAYQHDSPYGPPPSLPSPHSQQHSDAQSSNQYPQYSYDIQLRYPNPEPSRPNNTNTYPPPSPVQGLPLPPINMAMQDQGAYGGPQQAAMDTTGQAPPPGVKPRVTATLWEDEGTLCFQVDVRGTCVARREDNHMINGTKLLNVAGMTRGRRDGILKSEKQKHVVKIGPMHLKGVWIPFERALEFANKEKITEYLYPLFVHNIGALLYHPVNRTHPAHPTYPLSPPPTQHSPHPSYTPNHSQHSSLSQIPRSEHPGYGPPDQGGMGQQQQDVQMGGQEPGAGYGYSGGPVNGQDAGRRYDFDSFQGQAQGRA